MTHCFMLSIGGLGVHIGMLLRGSGRGRDIILTRGSISDGQEAGSLLVGNCFQPYIRKVIFKNLFFHVQFLI